MAVTAMELVKRARQGIREIDVAEARSESYKDALFLDTREPTETTKGIIPGAVTIPRGLLEFQVDPGLPSFQSALETDQTIVVYCASGGRSALAVERMMEMGYSNIVNLQGGYTAWKEGGGETTA